MRFSKLFAAAAALAIAAMSTPADAGAVLDAVVAAAGAMTCAAAVISPMVSFLTRKPVMMAAVMRGDISPFMISRIRCSISS